MKALNAKAARFGAPPIPLGLDLAHAIGNVPLRLHEWEVDFAAWCTYKYLNSGAGCLAGIFVHANHARDSARYPRLSGWWGVPFAKRFEMAHGYEEAAGAAGFGVSNVNMLMVACVHASLDVFQRAGGIASTRRKSLLLTGYLEALLHERGLLREAGAKGSREQTTLELVTPADPRRRGCQLSLRVRPAQSAAKPMTMRELERALASRGVVGDAREPDIMRLAPAPLYNSFTDVLRVVGALQDCLRR
uniref:Kynureninase n=1 Tax=Haptolina brevifila TaxID=156173 RepID=A0A7S2HC62_9EUKA